MKQFKIIQIYIIPANSKREAMDKWHEAEVTQFFETSIVKQVEERGFFEGFKKQIAG